MEVDIQAIGVHCQGWVSRRHQAHSHHLLHHHLLLLLLELRSDILLHQVHSVKRLRLAVETVHAEIDVSMNGPELSQQASESYVELPSDRSKNSAESEERTKVERKQLGRK